MMTIKHITPKGGESIFEVEEIAFSPSQEAVPPSVWYRSPGDDELLELREGTVYVMNGQGSTVAKYELGDWKPRILGDGNDAGVQVGSQLHRTA